MVRYDIIVVLIMVFGYYPFKKEKEMIPVHFQTGLR
jgi:hypothetical protein